MERELSLFERLTRKDQPPIFVAEIGANHNGDMEIARRLVEAAAEAGADAVKFQSWSAGSLFARSLLQNKDLVKEVDRHQLTIDQHHEMAEYCKKIGIGFFSTPFSKEEVDLLDAIEVPFFKIASMDVNYPSFLRYVAGKQRPVILSTGMATLAEIEKAVEAILGEGNQELVLLHCVSLYPPKAELVNLRNIGMLNETFGLPVGYSDHSLGVGAPLAAIALGARLIEKHFTLDKGMEGWDHAVSADPQEMGQIVREGRLIWESLGTYQRQVSAEEIEQAKSFRRSIVAARAMRAGEQLSEQDLAFRRPGTGIRPDELPYVLGRTLAKDVAENETVTWDHLS